MAKFANENDYHGVLSTFWDVKSRGRRYMIVWFGYTYCELLMSKVLGKTNGVR